MKRTIILLAIVWLAVTGWSRNSVWMTDFYLHTAETAQVPVILSNESAVTQIQCEVQLPVWCDETSTTFTLGDLTRNGTISVERPDLNVVRLTIKGAGTIKAGTGIIAYMTIRAPYYLRNKYQIKLTDIKLTNGNGTVTTGSDTKCTINPDALQRGDVNGDQIIDVEDVNRIINHILDLEPLSDVAQGDMDYNGKVDVADLNIVINAILDLDTTSRPYVASLDDLKEMLNDAYVSNNYAFLELCTDNLKDNQAPDENGNQYWLEAFAPSDSILFSWGDVTDVTDNWKYEDTPTALWKSCYEAIDKCNTVLELLPQFDHVLDGRIDTYEEQLYHSIKGEALVSRAYHHWLLVNVFCMPWAGEERGASLLGVPYMLEPGDPVDTHANRGTLLGTYNLIEQDLRAGIAELPHNAAVYQRPCYHFTTTSAHAFAAKFYLAKRDYEKVQAYATLAFNGGQPNLNNFWRSGDLYSGEDHVRANSGPDNPSILLSIPTYSVWSRRSGSRYGCKDDALRATVNSFGPTWSGTHRCYSGRVFYGGNMSLMFYANWGELFEYTDRLQGIGYVHMMRNEFTTDETLLARAEARIFLGDFDGALADLKMWLDNRDDCTNKASVITPLTAGSIERFYNGSRGYGIEKPIFIDEVCPSNKYAVTEEMVPWLQCVQHFQRMETVHTGKRWFDIKRFGLEIEHAVGSKNGTTTETLTVNDNRRAIQIPEAAINAGMQPNPR